MNFKLCAAAVATAVAVSVPMSAFATNGYFAHGYGTQSKGLAGAGAAFPQDALAAATNPAGMVFVGNRGDVGAAWFAPMREYTVEGNPTGACATATQCTFGFGTGTVESENEGFLIPHFGMNWMLDDVSSLGVSVYGNGGMNTEYKDGSATFGFPAGTVPPGIPVTQDGTFGGGTAGVNLEQLFIAATYARKFNENASWGISPIFAYQRFKAEGLELFGDFGFSTDPSNLSNEGTDSSTGYGVKLGVQGKVSPVVTLAASYQTKMEMEEFDKYEGLFAEDGDFDIPATATIGLAWQINPSSALVADIQQIYYGDVDAIANPMSNLIEGCAAGDASQCLGGSNGAGFGWEDMTIFKLGYQWATSPEWTWRVGYSHADQPIPDEDVMFNILAPGVIEDHVTFGFTRQLAGDAEFNFAAMYALSNDVSGPNPMDPAQTIELEMDQYELEASYSWKF